MPTEDDKLEPDASASPSAATSPTDSPTSPSATGAQRSIPPGMLCPACAYDLTGSTSGKCSECGRNITPSDLAFFADLAGLAKRQSDTRVLQCIGALCLTVPLICLGPGTLVIVVIPLAGLLFTPIITGELFARLLHGQLRLLFLAHFYRRLWVWHRPWMTAILCAIPMPMFYHWADVYRVSGDAPYIGCVILTTLWAIFNAYWAYHNLRDSEWRRLKMTLPPWKRWIMFVACVGLYLMSTPVIGLIALLLTRVG